MAGLLGILIGVFAACGGNGDTGNGGGQTSSAANTAPATQATDTQAAQTNDTSATQDNEPEFTLQYTAITRTHPTFEAMERFVQTVEARSDGRVKINMNSYPELGIAGPDTLGLLKNGTLSFAMIYSGYVAGEFPLIEMG